MWDLLTASSSNQAPESNSPGQPALSLAALTTHYTVLVTPLRFSYSNSAMYEPPNFPIVTTKFHSRRHCPRPHTSTPMRWTRSIPHPRSCRIIHCKRFVEHPKHLKSCCPSCPVFGPTVLSLSLLPASATENSYPHRTLHLPPHSTPQTSTLPKTFTRKKLRQFGGVPVHHTYLSNLDCLIRTLGDTARIHVVLNSFFYTPQCGERKGMLVRAFSRFFFALLYTFLDCLRTPQPAHTRTVVPQQMVEKDYPCSLASCRRV
jgi:hypothetical protein